MELFEAFGIDLQALLFNIITFVVFYAVIVKFGIGPIRKFVQERTDKIEEGVKNADAAAKALEEAKTEQERLITAARKEAKDIVSQAHEQAKAHAEKEMEETKAQLKEIAARAEKSLQNERDQMLRQTKEQAVELVVAATEKILREKVDASVDSAYISSVMDEVSK